MRSFWGRNYGNACADVGQSDVVLTAESAQYARIAVATSSNTGVIAGYEFWRAGARSNWWNTNAVAASSGDTLATPITGVWEFNQPVVFRSVLIRPYDTALTNSPRIWTIDGSNDGTTWSTLASLTTTFASAGDYTYNFTSFGKFMRYRIRITNANRSSSISIVLNKLWLRA